MLRFLHHQYWFTSPSHLIQTHYLHPCTNNYYSYITRELFPRAIGFKILMKSLNFKSVKFHVSPINIFYKLQIAVVAILVFMIRSHYNNLWWDNHYHRLVISDYCFPKCLLWIHPFISPLFVVRRRRVCCRQREFRVLFYWEEQ